MSIELKEHNIEGYEKAKDMSKVSRRVAIIHPTGTGKSYIALKFAEDNPEKRILYLAPSNSILHQVKTTIIKSIGKMFGNLKRMTYAKLSRLTEEELAELNPHIIVLDEFHHCGAPVWGEAVERLIDDNPNSFVLGLSATPIRYFDGNIDMAEELFGGFIASEISFEEAIERGILPEFDYVSALYGYKSSLRALEEQVNDSSASISKIEEAKILYNQLKAQLDENMEELPEILERHLENKNGKYLVFCRNIEDMEQKIAEAQALFSKVNPNIKIYRVSSSERDIRKNERTLTEFENDNSENTLKLMFSVNMLNEGYHIPDIDAVIMMRPTQSPTIYAQQMGRALSVGNKRRPKIIDLVDNFDIIRIIENFSERMKQYEKNGELSEDDGTKVKGKVLIYDYLKDINKIVSKIENLTKRRSLTTEQKIDLFEKFINDENTDERIIKSTVYEGYPIGTMIAQIRHELKVGVHNYSSDEIERLKSLGLLDEKQRSGIGEKITRLEEFCKNYSELWFLRNDSDFINEYFARIENQEERARLLELLEIAYKEYRYLCVRKSKGKISNEDIERLREAGVGGVFGYKKEIVELSEKYAISSDFISKQGKYKSKEEYEKAKEEQIKRFQRILYKLDMKYGGLDNFRKYYIQSLCKGKSIDELYYSDLDRFVTTFDLGEIDFIARPYKNIYYDILKGIIGDNKILDSIIFDSKTFKEKIEEYLSKTTESAAQTFRLVYGLEDGVPKTYAEVGKILSVAGTTIGVRMAKIERGVFSRAEKGIVKLDADRQKEFIEKYFEYCDIFVNPNSVELPESIRKQLLDIINIGIIEQQKREKQMKLFEGKKEEEIYKFIKEIYGNEIEVDKLKFLPISIRGRYKDNDIINLDELINRWCYRRDSIIHAILKQALEDININVDYNFDDVCGNVRNNGNVEIIELGFSEKTLSCLKKIGITKLYNLVILTEEQLKQIEGLTPKEYYEVIYKLNSAGLDINMRTDMIIESTNIANVLDDTDMKMLGIDMSTIDSKEVLGNISIKELDLSVRSYNCLNRANINTVYDIAMLTDEELRNTRNLGYRSYKEIIEKLTSMGISLYDEQKSKEENEESLKQVAISLLKIVSDEDLETVEKIEKNRSVCQDERVMLPIEELNLSIRPYNCLARAGIKTVYDIVTLTEEQLGKIRNLGKKSVDEVIEKIKSMGLSFVGSDSLENQGDLVDITLDNMELFRRKKHELIVARHKKEKKIEQLRELLEAKRHNAEYFNGEQAVDPEIEELIEKFLGTKGKVN